MASNKNVYSDYTDYEEERREILENFGNNDKFISELYERFNFTKIFKAYKKKDSIDLFDEFKELFKAKNPKLIKLVFKFNPSLISEGTLYGDYFYNIFDLILSNKNLHATIDNHVTENALILIMLIFKERFHNDFINFYQEQQQTEKKMSTTTKVKSF